MFQDRGKEEAYEESKLNRQRPGSLHGEPQRTRFDEPMVWFMLINSFL